MANIIVCGDNFLGDCMFSFFRAKHNVVAFNPWAVNDQEKIRSIYDIAFICVDTPQFYHALMRKQDAKDKKCDTNLLEEMIVWCEAKIIIILSTIEPGTIDRLIKETGKNLVYLSQLKNIFVFGGNQQESSIASNLFKEIGGHEYRYIRTSAKTAELFKYVHISLTELENEFIEKAIKVCNKIGVDYSDVRELLLLDDKIDPKRTVPRKFSKNDIVIAYDAFIKKIEHDSFTA